MFTSRRPTPTKDKGHKPHDGSKVSRRSPNRFPNANFKPYIGLLLIGHWSFNQHKSKVMDFHIAGGVKVFKRRQIVCGVVMVVVVSPDD